MPKTSGRFVAQFYESEASVKSPYAVTPDESKWSADEAPSDYDSAMNIARHWTIDGHFKSVRVVEVDGDNNPVSVAWASAWEAPAKKKSEQGASGIPGYACKLMIWMDRDMGQADHWGWRKRLDSVFGGNNNAWDFVYGRPVDTRGRMTLYSVKLNLWPEAKKHPSKWNWWAIMGKDPVEQRDEIEFVRAADIGPREFPSGVETNDCVWCGKTHLKSTSWMGWNEESEEMEPHCSCFCIDERFDTDHFRADPDGLEFEDPGCVQERAKVAAV